MAILTIEKIRYHDIKWVERRQDDARLSAGNAADSTVAGACTGRPPLDLDIEKNQLVVSSCCKKQMLFTKGSHAK